MNFTETLITSGSIEKLNITYKRAVVNTPFENDMKGYELYINGDRSYIVLTKSDEFWIAYDLHQADLRLRKATEHIAGDSLKEAKEVILRMLNIELQAQEWYNTAKEQKDPQARHLAIIVGDSVLEYNTAQKHCIDAFNNRLTELEVAEDLEHNINTARAHEQIACLLDMYLTTENEGEKNAYRKRAYNQALKIQKNIFTIYLKHKATGNKMDLKQVTGINLWNEMLQEIAGFNFNKNIAVRFK